MTAPLKVTDRFPAETRKQQIVETVLGLIATRGTEAISFQMIADEIGVTQPAVFRHFPTKEALWLAVMDWLEQRLVGIYSSADAADAADKSPLVSLTGMFLAHIELIERYPALAKLVFSDHLRLQFPSLQARFGDIHRAYMLRLSAVLERGRSGGVISESVAPRDGATVFLSLVQGLGFQFAIARLAARLQPEAERVLALYLRGLMCEPAALDRIRHVIEVVKRRRKASAPAGRGKWRASPRTSTRRR